MSLISTTPKTQSRLKLPTSLRNAAWPVKLTTGFSIVIIAPWWTAPCCTPRESPLLFTLPHCTLLLRLPVHACNHCWLLVWQIAVGLEMQISHNLRIHGNSMYACMAWRFWYMGKFYLAWISFFEIPFPFPGTSTTRPPSRLSEQTRWSRVWRKAWVACVWARGGRWSSRHTGDMVKMEVSHWPCSDHTLHTLFFLHQVMFSLLYPGVSSWRSSQECRALLWAGVSGAAEGCAWRLHVCVAGRRSRPPLSCYGPQWWQRGPFRGGKQTSSVQSIEVISLLNVSRQTAGV